MTTFWKPVFQAPAVRSIGKGTAERRWIAGKPGQKQKEELVLTHILEKQSQAHGVY